MTVMVLSASRHSTTGASLTMPNCAHANANHLTLIICILAPNIPAIGTPGTSISSRLLKQLHRFLATAQFVADMCLIVVA